MIHKDCQMYVKLANYGWVSCLSVLFIGVLFITSATNITFDSLVKDIEGEDVESIDYLMNREKDRVCLSSELALSTELFKRMFDVLRPMGTLLVTNERSSSAVFYSFV
ncbi:MAG: hypothetical protein N0C88_21815 [Candidatus Thiodiazotropha lotti]|uniref:Uncharacterized protein n=1 Tax=Candidatus Thiodiazotropha lotti TaxID=2792787 RepID=A0A9E4N1E7_9GAMM|nr:hypothetical protein [Candidatus Thiodiazotropha lotti]MCW4205941.1 hypothetical protein [Candidatus Thiodiazotropha lotti]